MRLGFLYSALLWGAAVLTDGRGRLVDLAATPARIVSCSVGSDETLLALVRRAGHPERLVAVSALADDARYSNIAGGVPATVRGRCGAELESLLKLKPDLAVLASYNRPETLARLDAAGVKTFVLGAFATVADIEANITALGRLTHLTAEAAALAGEVQQAVDAAARKRPARPPKVLQFFPDGSVSGAETLFDDLTRLAGGINLAAAQGLKGWPRLSAETLAGLRPDLVVAGGEASDRAQVLRALRQTPGWKEMPAVKDGRLLLIPDRELSATSAHIAGALSKLSEGFAAANGKGN